MLLKNRRVVDATLIPALTSTKNNGNSRDAEIHASKKDNRWHFGMKAYCCADAESGVVTPYAAHQSMSGI